MTETKAAFKTIELIAYVTAVIAEVIAGLVLEEHDAGGLGGRQVWLYVALLAVGYKISRGSAEVRKRASPTGIGTMTRETSGIMHTHSGARYPGARREGGLRLSGRRRGDCAARWIAGLLSAACDWQLRDEARESHQGLPPTRGGTGDSRWDGGDCVAVGRRASHLTPCRLCGDQFWERPERRDDLRPGPLAPNGTEPSDAHTPAIAWTPSSAPPLARRLQGTRLRRATRLAGFAALRMHVLGEHHGPTKRKLQPVACAFAW